MISFAHLAKQVLNILKCSLILSNIAEVDWSDNSVFQKSFQYYKESCENIKLSKLDMPIDMLIATKKLLIDSLQSFIGKWPNIV